jgi:hypothetical protein
MKRLVEESSDSLSELDSIEGGDNVIEEAEEGNESTTTTEKGYK